MSTGAPDPGHHERAVVSEERARAFLAAGELELLGRIPWASNATVLAKVTHEGLEGLAVYKPARGERPLWDFPNGTLYRREVAAYLVSERLGWRLVPPTLARDGPLGVGSVQLYVDADPEVTAFELLADEHPGLARVAAFDVVTNNADRKAGHCLAGARHAKARAARFVVDVEPLARRAVVRKHQRAGDLTVHLHGRRGLRVDRGAGNKQRRANSRGYLRFTKLLH